MTFEELKKEAKAHGYRLVQNHRYERLLPCICGSERREHWYDKNGVALKCKKCGMSATGKTEKEARRNWNQTIVRLNIENKKVPV